jgi:hypothetical protein
MAVKEDFWGGCGRGNGGAGYIGEYISGIAY